jgi:hypothetical protein
MTATALQIVDRLAIALFLLKVFKELRCPMWFVVSPIFVMAFFWLVCKAVRYRGNLI